MLCSLSVFGWGGNKHRFGLLRSPRVYCALARIISQVRNNERVVGQDRNSVTRELGWESDQKDTLYPDMWCTVHHLREDGNVSLGSTRSRATGLKRLVRECQVTSRGVQHA